MSMANVSQVSSNQRAGNSLEISVDPSLKFLNGFHSWHPHQLAISLRRIL